MESGPTTIHAKPLVHVYPELYLAMVGLNLSNYIEAPATGDRQLT
jgi:hypothetical protein